MTLTETRRRKALGHGIAICVAACLWASTGTDTCRAQQAAVVQPGQSQGQAPTELVTQLTLLAQQPPQSQENTAKAKRGYRYRVAIPNEIPGASAPPIRVPPYDPEQSNAQRVAALERLYHGLPPLPPRVEPQPGPCGGPMTLAELQAMAIQRSPVVRQAEADVTSAQGAMIQAGTPQNPTAGFEGDTIGTVHTGGYQGLAVEQLVPTGGKLRLARAAREMDLKNAQVALRRTYFDVYTTVRTNYFATLVAVETLKINRALAEFTDEVYRVQIDRVKAGEAAPYEPMQVRVLAFQAHAAVVQSTNAYLSSWRQLAAALCAPDMPPTQLAGDIGMPVPNIAYQVAWCWIMEHHSKLMMARNSVCGAQFALTLARRTPWVPDLDISGTVQRDFTTLPDQPWVYSLKSSVPLPFWDQNHGNILAAEGALAHANHGYALARDSLASTLADAYARYDTNKITVDYYRRDIIGDQVQSWRGLWERHQEDPDAVQFTDVVSAQQTLAQTIGTYAQTLGAQWQAVVDLADLMEVDDLFQIGTVEVPEQLPLSQPAPR
jgi:cobalt-zinc-cadmium efflux system outer membrane protein